MWLVVNPSHSNRFPVPYSQPPSPQPSPGNFLFSKEVPNLQCHRFFFIFGVSAFCFSDFSHCEHPKKKKNCKYTNLMILWRSYFWLNSIFYEMDVLHASHHRCTTGVKWGRESGLCGLFPLLIPWISVFFFLKYGTDLTSDSVFFGNSPQPWWGFFWDGTLSRAKGREVPGRNQINGFASYGQGTKGFRTLVPVILVPLMVLFFSKNSRPACIGMGWKGGFRKCSSQIPGRNFTFVFYPKSEIYFLKSNFE